jgi:hypothetical protein
MGSRSSISNRSDFPASFTNAVSRGQTGADSLSLTGGHH